MCLLVAEMAIERYLESEFVPLRETKGWIRVEKRTLNWDER
jgi:hypothetical protein